MSGLPAIKYRGLSRFIRGPGYELQRVDGSHERYYLKSQALLHFLEQHASCRFSVCNSEHKEPFQAAECAVER